MRHLTALAILLLLLGSARSAAASPTFPATIAQHLGGPAPPCSVCHDGTPQLGTATAPFAIAMRRRGLVAGDLGSLTNALDALAGEQTDTDGDGFIDTVELKKGWDPNLPNLSDGSLVPGGQRPQTLQATYGCALSTRSGGNRAFGALLMLASAIAGLRRRRSKSGRVSRARRLFETT